MSTQALSGIWKNGTPNWFCLAWVFGVLSQMMYPVAPHIFGTPLVGGFLWIPIFWTILKLKIWMWSNAMTFANTIPSRVLMWITGTPSTSLVSLSSWKRFYKVGFKIKFALFPIWTYLLPWYFRNSTTTYLVLLKRFHTPLERSRWLSFSLICTFNELVKSEPLDTVLVPALIQAGLDWQVPVAHDKREKIDISLLCVFSKWLADLDPNRLKKNPPKIGEIKLLCFDLGHQGLILTSDDFPIHDPELGEALFSAYREGVFMHDKEVLNHTLPEVSNPSRPTARRL